MSRDYEEEALNSEFGYKIFRLIYLDICNTPSEIAKSLDSNNASISNYLKGLRDKDLVKKKNKEGRSQPYTVNKKELLEKWFIFWNDKTLETKKDTEKEFRTLQEVKDEIGEELLFKWPKEYFDEYLETNEEASISEMIEYDFALSLFFMYYYYEEYPSHIQPYVKQIIVPFGAYTNSAQTIVGMDNGVTLID